MIQEKGADFVKKCWVTEDYYYTKTRDLIGGTIRTSVFRQENGAFQAFSSYFRDEDEEVVGYYESYDDEKAVSLSRKDLRKLWKEKNEASILI